MAAPVAGARTPVVSASKKRYTPLELLFGPVLGEGSFALVSDQSSLRCTHTGTAHVHIHARALFVIVALARVWVGLRPHARQVVVRFTTNCVCARTCPLPACSPPCAWATPGVLCPCKDRTTGVCSEGHGQGLHQAGEEGVFVCVCACMGPLSNWWSPTFVLQVSCRECPAS